VHDLRHCPDLLAYFVALTFAIQHRHQVPHGPSISLDGSACLSPTLLPTLTTKIHPQYSRGRGPLDVESQRTKNSLFSDMYPIRHTHLRPSAVHQAHPVYKTSASVPLATAPFHAYGYILGGAAPPATDPDTDGSLSVCSLTFATDTSYSFHYRPSL
jgi:hypothetical protein